jgi:ABC-type hemin transport system substrate-binding protein
LVTDATVFAAEFATLFMADMVELRAAVTGFVAELAEGSSIVGRVGTGMEPSSNRPVMAINR